MADQFHQYSEKVMEHFRNPRNVGDMKDPDGIGHVGNPVCVIPETLVYANPDIREIVKLKEKDYVLAHDGEYHRVERVHKRQYKGKVYSIFIHNIGTTVTTPDHHILALKNSNSIYKFKEYKKYTPDWYSAEELEKGDTVLYPIPKQIVDREEIDFDVEKPKWDFKSKELPKKINISDDFLRLVGYYLAEGYVRTDRSKGTVGFVFGKREMNYVGEVISIMDEIFGLKPNDVRCHHNSLNLLYYSARLARFFEKSFGKGAENKFIPTWVMLLSPRKQEALIYGLWRGDGYINSKGAKYVTISKRLAYQLRLLLLRQKIIFSFLTVPKRDVHRENYCIYVKEDNSLKKLGAIIKAKINRAPKKRNPHKSWFDNNNYYATIRKIQKRDYRGPVYNLDVNVAHSYTSNSLCLHNCGDIMELYIKVKDDVIIDAKFKTFGCLPVSEEVVLSSGGWGKISNISKGANVINSWGEEAEVVENYIRKYKGPLLKIIPFVSPYNSFSVTPEHPVLCIKRSHLNKTRRSGNKCDWLQTRDKEELIKKKPDYVKAKDIEKSDYLVFTANKEVKDNRKFTKDVMRLIGYYLSEGYMHAKESVVAFTFNKDEKKAVEDLKSLIMKITNKEAKERVRKSVREVYVCSRKLARFLKRYAGSLARNKCLSKEIMLLPFEKQKELIKTYLIGDGNFYRRRPGSNFTYRASTVSPLLAIQIQEILARGRIFASIKKIYKSEHIIERKKIKPSWAYLISFQLERKHNFVHKAKNYFLVPVRKVERKPFKGHVYNFQVASEPNSYLVKGFAVHNCGAAIATSSMITELVKGKTIQEALDISNRAVAEALGGLPPIKMHCSVLAEEALKSAIEDYLKKRSKK